MRAVIAGAMLLVLAGCDSGASYSSSPEASPSSSPPATCSPAPCGIASDMTLYVTSVDKDYKLPRVQPQHAGDHFVRIGLRFEYHGRDTRSASAQDIKIIGPDHIQGTIGLLAQSVAPGCDIGNEPELAAGAVYSISPCAEVGGDPSGPLLLRYEPSFFSNGVSINLP